MMKIYPSLLSADFLHLERELIFLEESGADAIHLDIMDGSFVPNISYGFPLISTIRKKTKMFLDAHLMIVNPEKYCEAFAKLCDGVTFHYEATIHHDSLIRSIKESGAMAGIAINPSTSAELLEPILPIADLVLVMSVNPGFGGQKFIDYTLEKIRKLASLKEKNSFQIEVDGGVTIDNAAMLLEAGADILVSGSDIFFADNPKERISEYKRL